MKDEKKPGTSAQLGARRSENYIEKRNIVDSRVYAAHQALAARGERRARAGHWRW
jgi:hypothetical protein